MKFNSKSTGTQTTNLAGGFAYSETPEVELVSHLLTSFVKDQFYRTEKEGLTRLKQLIDLVPDKKFIAKTAIYARTKFGMRSISHVVAGEIAARVKGEQWTKNFFDQVIHRPDDMMEILAYYYSLGKKNEPNAVRKGFSSAFSRFDEYQLAKYRKEDAEVSLIDVANLVHPTHSDAVHKLITGTLKAFDTWENELSKAGQEADGDEEKKDELKANAWKTLIAERKIGYFALLKNLRNILEQAPDMVDAACELLIDPKLIQKSLVLPFRFVTALEEIGKVTGVDTANVRKVIMALNKAIDVSTSNVPALNGRTLVVLDGSGSMSGKPFIIGSLFASILVKANNADYMVFADHAQYQNLNPMDSTLTIREVIERRRINGGTNFHAIFEEINKPYDRIIVLSDMQGWMGYGSPITQFNQYKTRYGVSPKIFSFDLAGMGTLQMPQSDIYCMAGFSDKIFQIMKLLEEDRNAMVNEINKIEL